MKSLVKKLPRALAIVALGLLAVHCAHAPNSGEFPAESTALPRGRAPRLPDRDGRLDPTDLCLRLLSRIGAPYRALYRAYRRPAALPERGVLVSLAGMTEIDCDADRRDRSLRLFAEGLSEHSGRIGVLLPLTGAGSEKSKAILTGVQAAFQETGKDQNKLVVVRDSKGSVSGALEGLASLLFNANVALVIAAVTPAETSTLAGWADRLNLPILFLSREEGFLGHSRYSFRVFPDEKMLGEALAEAAKTRGYQHLAVLRPDNAKADRLIAAFTSSATKRGMQVLHDVPYSAGNFRSMDNAVKKIFNVDPETRAEEYRELVHKEKRKAKEAGQKFNPRQVILKPEIDIDALFLPDDFRMVRHFVKLVQYNGVKKLPVLGNYEWRSTGLVEPPEPFLKDSFFADFIGSYDLLPAPLKVPDLKSPLFATPDLVKDIDFELVGYRGASIALLALANGESKRWKLPFVLEAQKAPGNGFFPPHPSFAKDHNGFWPAFVFFLTQDPRENAGASD